MPTSAPWTAGAFSILIALGGAGPEAAVGMIVPLLAMSVLQHLVQRSPWVPHSEDAATMTAAVAGISTDLSRARTEARLETRGGGRGRLLSPAGIHPDRAMRRAFG